MIMIRTEDKALALNLNGVPMIMRWIPPGTFMMGSPDGEFGRMNSEGPQHEVTITEGFWMAETPVTWGQWESAWKEEDQSGPWNHPAGNLNWYDCQYYCALLTDLCDDRLKFGLPTEAQWEYACRAGTTTPYNDGRPCRTITQQRISMADLGFYIENANDQPHPVAQKALNAWGLHDMHGGVWEWCEDWWQGNYEGAGDVDPVGPPDGRLRVIRGGSAWDDASCCRSAYRFTRHPGGRIFDQGFRPAATQIHAKQEGEKS